ncbi:MAG: PilZ domain-containing protein [Hyphomicrobiaceae bacterium]
MRRGLQAVEKRGFGRREVTIHAFAHIPGRRAEPCTVRNLSESGALVDMAVELAPASVFRLVVEAKGIDHLCEVRRRDGMAVGVHFVDGDKAEDPPAVTQEPALAWPSGDGLEDDAPPAAPPVVVNRRSVVTLIAGDVLRRQMFANSH